MLLFFNDTATTEIYTYGHPLSLHDALPICTRLLELDSDADRVEQLGAEVAAGLARVHELATRLTEQRRAAATRLQDAVSAELQALAMPEDRKSTRLNSSH